jgi:hypothetical protein
MVVSTNSAGMDLVAAKPVSRAEVSDFGLHLAL